MRFLQLLVFMVVVGFTTAVNAQDVYFSEDFEDTGGDMTLLTGNGWLNVDVDGNSFANYDWGGTEDGQSPWGLVDETGAPQPATNDDGGLFAAAAGSWFPDFNCCADDWLITPAIEIDNVASVILQYKWRSYQAEWPEAHAVYISTSNTIADITADGTLIYETCEGCFNNGGNQADLCEDMACNCVGADGSDATQDIADAAALGWTLDASCGDFFVTDWQSMEFDVTDFAGQTVYLAFHHYTFDQTALMIDDIYVGEPLAFDAAFQADASPLYRYATAPLNQIDLTSAYMGSVTNNGSQTLTGATYQVIVEKTDAAGEFQVESTVSSDPVDIAPGETVDFDLTAQAYSPDESGQAYLIYAGVSHDEDQYEADAGIAGDNGTIGEYFLATEEEFGLLPYFFDADQQAAIGVTVFSGFNDIATETDYSIGFVIDINETAYLDSATMIIQEIEDGGGINGDFQLDIYNFDGSIGDLIGSSDTYTGDGLDVVVETVGMSCPVELTPGQYFIAGHKLPGATGQFQLVQSGSYTGNGLQFLSTDENGWTTTALGATVFALVTNTVSGATSVSIDETTNSLTVDVAGVADGAICDWQWDFGDGGSTVSGSTASNTYTTEGTYTITLTATDINGNVLTSTSEVTVGCALTVAVGDITPGGATATGANGTDPITYEWFDADGNSLGTGESITGLTESTSYTVVATDATDCTAESDFSTTACALSSTGPILAGDGAGFFGPGSEISGGTPPYSYTWTDPNGSIIAQGIGQTAVSELTASGEYLVEVVDAVGCNISFNFTIVSLENISVVNSYNLYPNPASSFTTIELDLKDINDVVISIYNVNGQQVAVYNEYNTNNVSRTIDVSTLANGVYFVEFNIAGELATERLFIAR